MKNILIVEDDALQLNGLRMIFEEYDSKLNIYTVTSSQDAIKIYDSEPIDLFILDVDLSISNSDRTGIDIGLDLRQRDTYRTTPIIYITSVPEEIQAAVNNVHCFNYIIKPYNKNSIFKALDDLIKTHMSPVTSITMRDLNGIYVTLEFDDIFYIQTTGHVLNFTTKCGIFSVRTNSLKDVMDKLPEEFMQIHKSYVVNLSYILAYDKTTQIITIQHDSIPVGRRHKAIFEAIYTQGDYNGF